MYFDPGTGSMLVQIIVAAIASVGAVFFAFKNSIINFLKGVRGKDEKNKK